MSALFRDLDRHADRLAIIGDKGERLTYRDLLTRADAIGSGIRPRSLVMVVCTNTIDCLAGYLGILRAEAVPLLLHSSAPGAQRAEIAARFHPHHIYAPDADGTYRLEDVRGARQPEGAVHPDLALLLPTSGTTGSRNFVRLSARNILSNTRAIIDTLGIGPNDRPITTMPMNYTYGLSILQSHLLVGAAIVMTEHSVVSPAFWQLLREHAVTTFGGVPFIYETLRKLRFGAMTLPHLRLLTQAGGRLAPETAAAFLDIAAQKSIRFIIMYGQTEATARIATLPWEAARAKPGSIGVAIPGVTLSLIDDEGRTIEGPDVAGELVCQGDNVSMGYATDAVDLARPDENRGTLRTGDIARRDADGFYFIVGRKKRFVKIFGHRVNLDEMEVLLQRTGYDCACAGRDDRLRIFVAGAADPARVRADVLRLTGLHPQGFEVAPVATIVRGEAGKVDYVALEAGWGGSPPLTAPIEGWRCEPPAGTAQVASVSRRVPELPL